MTPSRLRISPARSRSASSRLHDPPRLAPTKWRSADDLQPIDAQSSIRPSAASQASA